MAHLGSVGGPDKVFHHVVNAGGGQVGEPEVQEDDISIFSFFQAPGVHPEIPRGLYGDHFQQFLRREKMCVLV